MPEYSSIKHIQDADDMCGSQEYDYFVYAGDSDGVNWNDAESFCSRKDGFDGTLASIECEKENNLAIRLRESYDGQVMWIGGSRKSGKVGQRTYEHTDPDGSWYVYVVPHSMCPAIPFLHVPTSMKPIVHMECHCHERRREYILIVLRMKLCLKIFASIVMSGLFVVRHSNSSFI